MHNQVQHVIVFTAICLLPSISTFGQDSFAFPEKGLTWIEYADRRENEIRDHMSRSNAEWRWFAEASHGEKAGAPFVFFKLLPHLAPDIWGSPSENFARFGFYSVPDTYFSDSEGMQRPLPLGLGWLRQLKPVVGGKFCSWVYSRYVVIMEAVTHSFYPTGRLRENKNSILKRGF